MDTKSTDWRAGPNVCRCCLSEGCYKDISTEYFWMGKREVYAEMLSDTLNLTIAYSQSGGPNSHSRLICELCISRLRDASDFRRQVVECEKTFIQHLDSTGSSELEVTVEPIETSVKLEEVKQEKRVSDDDFDDRVDFDDDDDDLDDQPLTTLASKMPKKVSDNLLQLLDTTKPAEKRKSTTKTKASAAKKSKTVKKETVKATASKVAAKEKKKKEHNPMYISRQNAKTVIKYTTAYPFKLPASWMVCVYCCDRFDDPSQFRDHMMMEHRNFKVEMVFAHLPEGSVKVDCTDLKCRLCNEPLTSLEQAAEHLTKQHRKTINSKHDLGMHAFKIYKGKYSCAMCPEKFATLRLLSKHTHSHYVQFTCETCGKSYATLTSLQCHLRYNCGFEPGTRMCRKCHETFTSIKEKTRHLEMSPMCRQHVCNFCGIRFVTWNKKQNHLKESHDLPGKSYQCPECPLVFRKRDKLRMHFKITHTNDFVECSYCDKKFENDKILKKHIVVHTGERNFVCTVCSKSFPRQSTLRQHMWIHSEVKKHECKMCDKTFNQRVSWRTHMKSRHPEFCEY